MTSRAPGDTVPSLRVVRIIARLNVGGPARHATLVDAGLRQMGFDTLLVYGSPAAGEASMEDLVSERALGAVYLPELGRRVRVWSDLRAFVKLLGIIFTRQPDIIHTHTAKAGALGRIAATLYNSTRRRSRRCLTVHTFHGHVLTGYFSRPVEYAVRMIERNLARTTDVIIAISNQQRIDLIDRFRIAKAEKVALVPLGLDLQSLLELTVAAKPRAKQQFGFSVDDVVFGFVGRFVPVKDLSIMIEAFARAAGSARGIRLLLVGDGDTRPALEALARNRGVDSQVRFAGWRRDLPAVYSAIDVLVLSSRNEGTPVSLIEAMAAGLPSIATNVGGVPDVLEHEETGLLVPPRDPERLSAAILRLASAPELRLRFGEKARLHARVSFGVDALVDSLATLYRERLGDKRSR